MCRYQCTRLGEVAAQRRVRVDRGVSRLDGPMLTTLSRQRERGQESAGTLNRYASVTYRIELRSV